MTYQVDETARLEASIKNDAGVFSDPATVQININRPDGTAIVENADMEQSETGMYYYDYLVPAITGTFRYYVLTIGGEGRRTIVKDTFQVEVRF